MINQQKTGKKQIGKNQKALVSRPQETGNTKTRKKQGRTKKILVQGHRMKYSIETRQKAKSKSLRSGWYEYKGRVRTRIIL